MQLHMNIHLLIDNSLVKRYNNIIVEISMHMIKFPIGGFYDYEKRFLFE